MSTVSGWHDLFSGADHFNHFLRPFGGEQSTLDVIALEYASDARGHSSRQGRQLVRSYDEEDKFDLLAYVADLNSFRELAERQHRLLNFPQAGEAHHCVAEHRAFTRALFEGVEQGAGVDGQGIVGQGSDNHAYRYIDGRRLQAQHDAAGNEGVCEQAGALIKDAAAIERMEKVDTLVVDKTGTLMERKPRLTNVIPAASISEQELLAVADAVEKHSEHPLAAVIV